MSFLTAGFADENHAQDEKQGIGDPDGKDRRQGAVLAEGSLLSYRPETGRRPNKRQGDNRMWYLYLDESGDLGFDFVNKQPSKYFAISVLALSGIQSNRLLINAIKHTLKRKLGKTKMKNRKTELKGSKTSFAIKQYFYQRCETVDFGIFSIILNKRRLYSSLVKEKDRVYNYIARLVMDRIPIERAVSQVEFIVDRSKTKPEIGDFNAYIVRMLQGRLDPKVALNITHKSSHQSLGLQAADLFCWGIFRKYEKKDTRWYSLFAKDKIKYETVFLPENKKSAPC